MLESGWHCCCWNCCCWLILETTYFWCWSLWCWSCVVVVVEIAVAVGSFWRQFTSDAGVWETLWLWLKLLLLLLLAHSGDNLPLMLGSRWHCCCWNCCCCWLILETTYFWCWSLWCWSCVVVVVEIAVAVGSFWRQFTSDAGVWETLWLWLKLLLLLLLAHSGDNLPLMLESMWHCCCWNFCCCWLILETTYFWCWSLGDIVVVEIAVAVGSF